MADGTEYSHEGRVVKASGVVDPATGTIQMIARFSNPERLLKSGGSGSIVINRADAKSIVIPQSVVSQVQDKKFVYVLVGDKYVTNGITKLSDGMEIKPITPEQYQKKIKDQAGSMTAGEIVKELQK